MSTKYLGLRIVFKVFKHQGQCQRLTRAGFCTQASNPSEEFSVQYLEDGIASDYNIFPISKPYFG